MQQTPCGDGNIKRAQSWLWKVLHSLVSFIPDLSRFHMSVEHEPVGVHLRPTLHSTCYCVLSNFLDYLSNSYDNLARGWRPRWAPQPAQSLGLPSFQGKWDIT